MAYDEVIVERVRMQLEPEPDVLEKRMFGGHAFLLGGHMAVAASGNGGLMVRVDPAESADLLERRGVTPMVMGGREMRGWLRVADSACVEDADLAEWVARGVAFVRTLPPK